MTRTNVKNVSRGNHRTPGAVRRVGDGAVAFLLATLFVLATSVSGVGATPDIAPADVQEEDLFLTALAIQDPAERADAFAGLLETDRGSATSESAGQAMLWAIKEARLESVN